MCENSYTISMQVDNHYWRADRLNNFFFLLMVLTVQKEHKKYVRVFKAYAQNLALTSTLLHGPMQV